MYALKTHHRTLLARLGVPMIPHHSAINVVRRSIDILATDINYGRDTRHQSPRLHLAHRVRIMEPGSSRVHFIDCEVPV